MNCEFIAAGTAGRRVSGLNEMRRDFQRAIAAHCLAWLRRAVSSYIVRKCREITAGKS